MNHDEIYEDTGKIKNMNGYLILETFVLSTAISYAKYSKGMEEITSFGTKNSLTLPSLVNKYFSSSRDEKNEHIYTCNAEYMRYFVRKSLRWWRCSSLNQYYISFISDEVFSIISTEIRVKGNVFEILNEHFEFT